MGEGGQLSSAVMLGVALALGLLVFFVVAVLIRAMWRWMLGGTQKGRSERQEPQFEATRLSGASGLSASDLFVIKTNLSAVVRQVEDLERRLRLEGPSKSGRDG
jgi:hypothetical protein